SVHDFRIIPYTKSKTEFGRGIYSTSFSFVMNEQKWNSLSKQDQAAIESVSGAKFGRMAASYWVEADQAADAEIEKAGIKIVKADPAFEAALVKIGDGLTQKWIATAKQRGFDGQAAYDFYVQRVKDLSGKTN